MLYAMERRAMTPCLPQGGKKSSYICLLYCLWFLGTLSKEFIQEQVTA